MVVKKPSAKSTKAELLEASDELTKEKTELKAQVDKLVNNSQVKVIKEQSELPAKKSYESVSVSPTKNELHH